MQNEALIHITCIIKKWLTDNKIEVMNWSLYFLNPKLSIRLGMFEDNLKNESTNIILSFEMANVGLSND